MMKELEKEIIEVLRSVFDPEIPVNIYDIGLVYDIDIRDTGDVHILMTLTSPMCPVAESLPPDIEIRVGQIEGVRSVTVEITWDPPWDPECPKPPGWNWGFSERPLKIAESKNLTPSLHSGLVEFVRQSIEGSFTSITVPPSSPDRALIFPPCASMIARLSASPKPLCSPSSSRRVV